MLKVQRHQKIIDYLKNHEFARVEDLVLLTNASEITVRRDIIELHDKGKLKKVHGGAQSVDQEWVNTDIDVETRILENIDIKKEIAKRASALVQDNMIVYLDAGSTVGEMIPLLKGKKIIVYTHGVHHVTRLVRHGIECHLVGGDVKPATLACVGVECIQALSHYKFDLAFLGTNAVDPDFGFSTPDVNEAAVKRKIIEQAHDAYCLVDHSKFYKISKVSFADGDALKIITDIKPEGVDTSFIFA